ncbi:MAG: DUF2953 domain-containing protein [Methanobacterium sp.]
MIYTIIGAIILILALILLAILLIPFHISFYIQKREMNISGYFRIRWLKIRIIQRDIPTEKKEEEKEVKKERKFNLEQLLKILNQFIEAFDYIKPLIPAFLRSITLKNLSLDLNLGFYSPVDTAMINGYIWSISSILNNIPLISISTTPDFQESKLEGSFELNLKLKLLWIVIASLKAFTKKPVRDLVGSIRNLNK